MYFCKTELKLKEVGLKIVQKNNAKWRIHLPNFVTYFIARVIRTWWYWWTEKYRSMGE